MPTPIPCEPLPWDSDFWGVAIARVCGDTLTPASAEAVDHWCAAHRTACLYFLARSNDAETVRLAEDRGYRLADVRLTYGWNVDASPIPAPPVADGWKIRPAVPSDVEPLVRIARTSHRDTRFYFDPRFPDAACDRFYETWVRNSFSGFADAVWVAAGPGGPAAYVTCRIHEGGRVGQIGLVGVAPEYRGLGIGRSVLQAALKWFTNQGVGEVRVFTQARNIAAQRLYQRAGFLCVSAQVYYHKWYRDPEPAP